MTFRGLLPQSLSLLASDFWALGALQEVWALGPLLSTSGSLGSVWVPPSPDSLLGTLGYLLALFFDAWELV